MEALTERLGALAHPVRLAVFRLLLRRYPDEVAAGEIGAALALKNSTLSVYLATLRAAGLITQRRESRSILYRANPMMADALIRELSDCCRARAAITAAPRAENHKYRTLFICTANSARSKFAQVILEDAAGGRFEAHSAGTRPAPAMDPLAAEVLSERGHNAYDGSPRAIDLFRAPHAPALDFVFTVCDNAANEESTPFRGAPISSHWGVADPAVAQGTHGERRRAYECAYDQLRERIESFVAGPFDGADRASLQRHADACAFVAGVA